MGNMKTLTTTAIAQQTLKLLKENGVHVVERESPLRQTVATFDGPPPYMLMEQYSSEVLSPMMEMLANHIGAVAAPGELQVPSGIDGHVASSDLLSVRILSRQDPLSGKLHMRADIMSYQ